MNADHHHNQSCFALLATLTCAFVYPGSFLIRAFMELLPGPDTGILTHQLRVSLWFVIAVGWYIALTIKPAQQT